jgi:hypothetical protein
MRHVFISYRRSDTASGYASWIYDRLTEAFGSGSVFMDMDSLPPGVDFVERIEASLAAADVMLVLIGPGWLHATSGSGERRLDDPGDVVRTEVASALRAGVRVIPLLIDSAQMPDPRQLPDDLKPLARRQALLFQRQGGAAIRDLISTIKHLQGKPPIEPATELSPSRQTSPSTTPRKRLAIGAVVIGLLAAIAVVAVAVGRSGSSAGSQQAGLGTAIGQLNKIPRAASLSASLNTTSKQLVNVMNGHGSASTIQPDVSTEVSTARQLLVSTTPPTASFSASGRTLNTSLQSLSQAALTLQRLQALIARLCGSSSCPTPTSLAQIKHDQAQLAKILSLTRRYDGDQSAALTDLRATNTILNHQLSQRHLLNPRERRQLVTADANITGLQSSVTTTSNALNEATSTKTQTLTAAATALTQTATTTPTSGSSSGPVVTTPSASSSSQPGSGSQGSPSSSAPSAAPTAPSSSGSGGVTGSGGKGSGSTPVG